MLDAAYDFEWDARKASSNLKKHGVSFERASTVLLDRLALTVYDDEHSQFEERWITLGHSSDGELLVMAHTVTLVSPTITRIRIISARPATKQERRFYADEPR